jgi:hypothetical protein
MHQLTRPEANCHIIGGVFSNRDSAQKATQSLRNLGVKHDDIQVVVRLNEMIAQGVFETALVNRGFSESRAKFFETALRGGKIFIAVHNINETGPVNEIFETNSAEYGPAVLEGRTGELTDEPLHWVNYMVKS